VLCISAPTRSSRRAVGLKLAGHQTAKLFFSAPRLKGCKLANGAGWITLNPCRARRTVAVHTLMLSSTFLPRRSCWHNATVTAERLLSFLYRPFRFRPMSDVGSCRGVTGKRSFAGLVRILPIVARRSIWLLINASHPQGATRLPVRLLNIARYDHAKLTKAYVHNGCGLNCRFG